MKNAANFAAVDLGASNGRVMLATLEGGHLTLKEAYRFDNCPVRVHDRQHWDALRLFQDIKDGIRKAGKIAPLSSIGIDTWGVDFALLNKDGNLLGNPFTYRDTFWNGAMERTFQSIPRAEIFKRTGIQFLTPNTLFQMVGLKDSALLKDAGTFLMVPDLFNYWLTGKIANEYTDATTTQFYSPFTSGYDLEMLARLGLPTDIYPEILNPGTILGNLLPVVAEETGTGQIPVILPACHDTGSAVAGTPLENKQTAYISSGTWSLVGAEITEPIITSQSLLYNFTNEGGIERRYRFLKNVFGLWLVQECRRVWASKGSNYSWDEITALSESAPPFASLIDPDNPEFFNPVDMPSVIQNNCASKKQPVPENHAAILRCIFESLAMKYRLVFNRIEEMLGFEIEIIRIIGGGSQNKVLSQFTANATGKPVCAGPVEATALGNIIVQAISLGHIGSLQEGREIIAQSFPPVRYEPEGTERWDEEYDRFLGLLTEKL